MKRSLLIIIAMTILLSIFAACSTMPENEITKVTLVSTVVETFAPTVNDVPSVTPDAQTTASAEPSATGSKTGNATVAPTATPKLTATVAPKKTETATKKNTATKTATPKPTVTTQKDVYQTIAFEGKTYKVLMGRNGNPNLIKDYSTLPKVLQAYAYPTFDKEAVMLDIYQYAKTKGFAYFSNPNVPLKTNPDTDLDLPEAFVPGGNMTYELALEAFSWYSPSVVAYLGDSVYTDEYYATEADDIISLREAGFSMVDFLAAQGKDYLCLWIRDYGDSSYRKKYWDNGLYNGKITKEYALYFMYGGRDTLVQEIEI